jgi:hypothetical protein
MPTSIIQLDQLFAALNRARGKERLPAFQAYAATVIAAQQRGELGRLLAASFLEGALQYPELRQYEPTAQLLAQVCRLQSPVQGVSADLAVLWRELVRGFHRLNG